MNNVPRFWIGEIGASYVVYDGSEIMAFRPDLESAEKVLAALKKQAGNITGEGK